MIFNKNIINFKVVAINAVLLLFISYFVYHSLNGERGLFAYFHLKKVFKEHLSTAKTLTDTRVKLEATIKYLHPNSINYDFLDELARKELGLASPDEKIIYLKK